LSFLEFSLGVNECLDPFIPAKLILDIIYVLNLPYVKELSLMDKEIKILIFFFFIKIHVSQFYEFLQFILIKDPSDSPHTLYFLKMFLKILIISYQILHNHISNLWTL